MSDETKDQASREAHAAKVTANAPDDLGASQAQDVMDEETDKGYRGVNPDPTPLAHYSVAGVNAGKPTPENDPAQAAKVAEHQRKLGL